MKKIVAAVLALTMILALVACGGAGKLKGKWVFGGVSYEFKDENAVSVNANGLTFDGTYKTEGKTLTITVTGLTGEVTKEFTYSIKGNTLTLNGDISMMGVTNTEAQFTRAK